MAIRRWPGRCVYKDPLLQRRFLYSVGASSTQHMWELLAGNHTAALPQLCGEGRSRVWCMCACCFNLSFENSELNCSTTYRIWSPPLRSKFFEILKFVFLSEVANKSFCVKFSGLISKLKIFKKSYKSLRIFNVQTYIWSLFKANKIYGVPMKPSELFCFKDTKNFATLLFFLVACNKTIPVGKCHRCRKGWKWSTRRLVEDGMSMGLTNTHTARGFSDLYHVFARKQCILCPALRHGCLTLLYVTSVRDFFCPWNNRAQLY